jgi:hypothetical protein
MRPRFSNSGKPLRARPPAKRVDSVNGNIYVTHFRFCQDNADNAAVKPGVAMAAVGVV